MLPASKRMWDFYCMLLKQSAKPKSSVFGPNLLFLGIKSSLLSVYHSQVLIHILENY